MGDPRPSSVSLTRPASAFTITRPSSLHTLGTSSSLSMFGEQVQSRRPTAAAYSFERLETGRPHQAKVFPGSRVDPLWRGEEHMRHHMPSTPNPGTYKVTNALGKQPNSKKATSSSYAFGRSERFAHIDRQMRHRRTPGPGEYRA